MSHAEDLRRLAVDLDDMRCLDISDEVFNLRAAADRIEQLEAANAILLRKTELHECPWCGFYGTPDGGPPEDEPAADGPETSTDRCDGSLHPDGAS